MLRREDEELGLAPQPSLAHVGALVRRAQASGLPVELLIDGEPRPLPAGVDLTAYRLVQETLGRARDAEAGSAAVMLDYGPSELSVEIVDDGAPVGPAAARAARAGRGLRRQGPGRRLGERRLARQRADAGRPRRGRRPRPGAARVRALRRIDQRYFDWLLAVGLVVGCVVEMTGLEDTRGPLAANLALVALLGPAALIRRRHPLIAVGAWATVAIGLSLFLTPASELDTPFFGLLLFPWAVGSHTEGLKSFAGLALALTSVVAVALSSDTFIWGDIFFPGAFATLFWLAGRAVRSRSRLTAELHEATVRLHEQGEAEAARAVADERRRIAREMHDVVAHSVSMMVIQAGGARRILARDPARAVEAAELIERTGRDALKEMRHLLGVLHAGEDLAELAPQPTLHGLQALVERSDAAGLPVRLRIEGERRELPSGLDLAAYRVVQEALTNALKHGGGSADVLVRFGDDELCLEIADAGLGPGVAHRVEGGGHGLVGMRERVRVFGGELHAGPRPEGGYLVTARLPLQDEEEAALSASTAARDHSEVLG